MQVKSTLTLRDSESDDNGSNTPTKEEGQDERDGTRKAEPKFIVSKVTHICLLSKETILLVSQLAGSGWSHLAEMTNWILQVLSMADDPDTDNDDDDEEEEEATDSSGNNPELSVGERVSRNVINPVKCSLNQ